MGHHNDGLVPTSEVAERLHVTPSGVSRMVRRGDLTPALRAPGRRGAFLFDPTEVDALAAERAR